MARIYLSPPETAVPRSNWAGSEAVIRLQPGPIFSGSRPITGRRQTGSRSIAATLILAARAQ